MSSLSIRAHTGTTSNSGSPPCPFTYSRTFIASGPRPCGSFSSTFATYSIGLALIIPSPLSALTCSPSIPSSFAPRIGLPASRIGLTFLSTSNRATSSFDWLFAARSAFEYEFSTVCRSARINSALIVSMSRTGSTVPSTCVTSSPPGAFSKHRTTCTIASTSRMCDRNLFPSPSPLLAPRTIPAMSTSRSIAGTTFCVSINARMISSRASGIGTTPTLGSIVANG